MTDSEIAAAAVVVAKPIATPELLGVITQAGALVSVLEKLNVHAVTTPPPTLIVPAVSVPTTEPDGVVPQAVIVGVPPEVIAVPSVRAI